MSAVTINQTRCEAVLGHGLRINANGFPERTTERCQQVVGVRAYRDAAGETHGYCARRRTDGWLHEELVRNATDRADAIRRATTEWAESELRYAHGDR